MKMLINGERVGSSDGSVVKILNPATLEVIDEVPAATKEDVEFALDCAQEGYKSWSETPLYERIEIMKKFRTLVFERQEQLAQTVTAELGKPIVFSRIEVDSILYIIDNFIEISRTLGGETFVQNNFPSVSNGDFFCTVREPLGVVACIVPFNFPVELYTHKVVAALLMGNSVVIKPASDTPLADIMLTEMLLEAGVPGNVAQIVTGSGAKIGKWLAESRKLQPLPLRAVRKLASRQL